MYRISLNFIYSFSLFYIIHTFFTRFRYPFHIWTCYLSCLLYNLLFMYFAWCITIIYSGHNPKYNKSLMYIFINQIFVKCRKFIISFKSSKIRHATQIQASSRFVSYLLIRDKCHLILYRETWKEIAENDTSQVCQACPMFIMFPPTFRRNQRTISSAHR